MQSRVGDSTQEREQAFCGAATCESATHAQRNQTEHAAHGKCAPGERGVPRERQREPTQRRKAKGREQGDVRRLRADQQIFARDQPGDGATRRHCRVSTEQHRLQGFSPNYAQRQGLGDCFGHQAHAQERGEWRLADRGCGTHDSSQCTRARALAARAWRLVPALGCQRW